ncbi:MAG: cupin domain-containing protein [Labilithrix sp.]|nr:cupin domain-containing protein [Labilithrix sp.]
MSPSRWKLFAVMATLLGSACYARLDDNGRAGVSTTGAITSAAGHERAAGTRGVLKNGFVGNIEQLTERNTDFRRVVYTAPSMQLVLMSIPPGEHIGAETHGVDQFFRIESGTGRVEIDGSRRAVGPGSAVVVPAGALHDVVADEGKPLQLYTLYAPPKHRDGVVHRTRAEAERDDETFDGRTTE